MLNHFIKELQRRWEALTEEERKVYEDMAKEQIEEFDQALANANKDAFNIGKTQVSDPMFSREVLCQRLEDFLKWLSQSIIISIQERLLKGGGGMLFSFFAYSKFTLFEFF